MTTNRIIHQATLEQVIQSMDGIVSLALLNRLSARIARREGRMKSRASDKWAKQEGEIQLPPAA